MHSIEPTEDEIDQALAAWTWIGLQGKRAIRVTAFGDVFLADSEGVFFLDTVEGTLTFVCRSEDELDRIVGTEEAKARHLLAALVDRAHEEGLELGPGECFGFSLDPVLGGEISFSNLEVQSFVVATHMAGQIHEQVRHLSSGTRIDRFTFDGESS